MGKKQREEKWVPQPHSQKRSAKFFAIFLTRGESGGKIQSLFITKMGLGAKDNLPWEDFDGRNLGFQVGVQYAHLYPLDPERGDWEAQKVAYGTRVAEEIADRAVPDLISRWGLDGQVVPGSGVDVDTSSERSWRINDLGGGIFSLSQRFALDIRVQSDFEMAAGNIIYAARDSIAAHVADAAVFALEQHFEGKQSNNTRTKIRRQNGQIVEFQRRTVPPPPPEGERKMAA